MLFQKAKPAMCEGNRNPHGLEMLSAGAERGNCPEAKPNRKGAERRTRLRVSRNLSMFATRTPILLLPLCRSILTPARDAMFRPRAWTD